MVWLYWRQSIPIQRTKIQKSNGSKKFHRTFLLYILNKKFSGLFYNKFVTYLEYVPDMSERYVSSIMSYSHTIDCNNEIYVG